MRVIGIDEVGRGCWAGPLVAGAVLLDKPIAGLKDSKKLSAKRREFLATQIYGFAKAYGLGWVTAAEVDNVGLTAAVRLAMERALQAITVEFDAIIIDGNFNFLAHLPKSSSLIKADDSVPAVSAASIIAKVARDDYMRTLPVRYNRYGFARHVGYGTAAHQAALQQFGVSDLHRVSYKPIKALLQ